MKTIIKTLAVALALSSTVVFASDPTEGKKAAKFEASTFISNDNSVRVAVQKNLPGRVQIALLDEAGQVLYSNTMSKKEMKYAAKFNLNELNDGNYRIEISSGEERITKQLNLSSKKAEAERKIKLQ